MDNTLHILQTSREIYSRIKERIHDLAFKEAVSIGGYSKFYNKYDAYEFIQQRSFLELIEIEIAEISDEELLRISKSGTTNPRFAVAEVTMPIIRCIQDIVCSERGNTDLMQSVGQKFLRL